MAASCLGSRTSSPTTSSDPATTQRQPEWGLVQFKTLEYPRGLTINLKFFITA